jgi:hypothetical protein
MWLQLGFISSLPNLFGIKGGVVVNVPVRHFFLYLMYHTTNYYKCMILFCQNNLITTCKLLSSLNSELLDDREIMGSMLIGIKYGGRI